MSALLRQPATVPALFSRAMDDEASAQCESPTWRQSWRGLPLLLAAGWAIVLLIDVPLVKAASIVAALSFPR